MFRVIILNRTPELTLNEYNALLPLVSLEKQERIKNYYFKWDAHNSLLGDVLVRMEICKIMKMKNDEIEFFINAYGKPSLVNNDYIHFNISHSGNYIACAISDKPVGIDIEQIRPVDLKIAERFFTPYETEYIKDDEHSNRFYEVWTKKEAYIKCIGKGLYITLSTFNVLNSDESENLIYHKVFQNDDVICHVCSTKYEKP